MFTSSRGGPEIYLSPGIDTTIIIKPEVLTSGNDHAQKSAAQYREFLKRFSQAHHPNPTEPQQQWQEIYCVLRGASGIKTKLGRYVI